MEFNDWVNFIFDHRVEKSAWHWDIDIVWPELEQTRVVAYLTQLFEHADVVLQPFSNAQVNQGLNLLVSASCSDYMFALRDAQVPLEDRLWCIRAMYTLFEKCFARRCSPQLSHLDEPGADPLNAVCYMWWDVLPIHGLTHHDPKRSDSAAIDRACLSVMQRILEIDSLACRESALHGLGHWSIYYADVKPTIDSFLKRHTRLRPELRRYAMAARQGGIL